MQHEELDLMLSKVFEYMMPQVMSESEALYNCEVEWMFEDSVRGERGELVTIK